MLTVIFAKGLVITLFLKIYVHKHELLSVNNHTMITYNKSFFKIHDGEEKKFIVIIVMSQYPYLIIMLIVPHVQMHFRGIKILFYLTLGSRQID